MKNRMHTLCLASLACLACLFTPSKAQAGDVGYYGDNCYEADVASIITAAGHTPVAVATLDAASLAGLRGLFINSCENSVNAAVEAAVENGLVLIWHDPNLQEDTSKNLPGAPGVPYVIGGSLVQIDFPAGSPVTTGPGGTIDDSSLDDGFLSNHGYVPLASLPGGSQVLATQDEPSHVTTFAYAHGSGMVVYSTIPVTCYLPGASCDEAWPLPGMQAYAINLIAWALAAGQEEPPAPATCASEGYTATQLTWCQNICEKGHTGGTLSTWIRRWTDRFRQLPYCMREEGGDLH